MLAALLLLLLHEGCSHHTSEVEPGVSYVDIYVHASASAVVSRADEGTVKAVSPEDAIYSVQVWAFKKDASDEAQAIGYVSHPYSATPIADGTVLSMPFLTEDLVANLHVDFYAVANTSGLRSEVTEALGQGKQLTKGELKELVLSGDDFGTASPVHGVPATGLPMSKVVEDKAITTTVGALSITRQDIPLRRAVSKIRFCIVRKSDVPSAQILGFTLDDHCISNNEYLLPNSDERTANLKLTGYNTQDWANGFTYTDNPLTALSQIKDISVDPSAYVYSRWMTDHSGTTAQDWEDVIKDITTEYGLTYLRETSKKLTGKLKYSVDGGATTAEVPFTMAEAGDFTRNHSYIVYVYFTMTDISLTVSTQPWAYAERNITYTDAIDVNEGDRIKWTDHTYWESMSDLSNFIIVLNPPTAAECKFRISAPLGYAWTATFSSVRGNATAFKFLDEEGNKHDNISGPIGDVATLKIVADQDETSINSEAELQIVVRNLMGAHTVLVTNLTPEGRMWRIVQQGN